MLFFCCSTLLHSLFTVHLTRCSDSSFLQSLPFVYPSCASNGWTLFIQHERAMEAEDGAWQMRGRPRWPEERRVRGGSIYQPASLKVVMTLIDALLLHRQLTSRVHTMSTLFHKSILLQTIWHFAKPYTVRLTK